MATLNKVMLIGTVCRPPESFTGQSGTVVGSFRLAVGRGKKDPNTGQWNNEDSLYIDCKAFYKEGYKRNLPDVIARFLSVGSSVYCEGRLAEETWDDKGTGQKRSKMVLMLESLELLGDKKGHQDGGEQEQPRQQAPQQQRRPQPTTTESEDSEIPFGWLVPALTALSSLGSTIV